MSKLVVLLSLDWEGESLSRIKDLKYFRKQIGEDIPLTHFIVPSYFIQFQENADLAHSLVSELDEVALHLHPLRLLVKHVGILFRGEANFYRAAKIDEWMRRIIPEKLHRMSGIQISGRGVPITVYPEKELDKLIYEARLLLSQTFPGKEIDGFRAGGNIINDDLTAILRDQDFLYDASAYPPEILSGGYHGVLQPGSGRDLVGDKNGLYTDYVIRLWGAERQDVTFLKNEILHATNPDAFINPLSQPFQIGSLLEFPINGGMADFVTMDYLNHTVEELLYLCRNDEKTRYLSLGLHLEGDIRYEALIAGFIQEIREKDVIFSTPNQHINLED